MVYDKMLKKMFFDTKIYKMGSVYEKRKFMFKSLC